MKQKLLSALLACALLMCTACGGQTAPEDADDYFEYDIDVTLNAYSEAGGTLLLTDGDGTFDSDLLGLLGAEGMTIGEVVYDSFSAVEPVLEGDTFEGWMEYTEDVVVDEDGFESSSYVLVSDTLYSTEELMELTLPDHAVFYVAKWASVPTEEYFAPLDAWDSGSSSGAFTFSANGGVMTFQQSDGSEISGTTYTYWLEDGQALNDIMGVDFYASLISVEQDGAEFAGWTLYEGDSVFWNDESVDEEDLTCFYQPEEDPDFQYLLLRNARVIRENAPTEELCGMSMTGTCYYAEANWN